MVQHMQHRALGYIWSNLVQYVHHGTTISRWYKIKCFSLSNMQHRTSAAIWYNIRNIGHYYTSGATWYNICIIGHWATSGATCYNNYIMVKPDQHDTRYHVTPNLTCHVGHQDTSGATWYNNNIMVQQDQDGTRYHVSPQHGTIQTSQYNQINMVQDTMSFLI